MSLSEYKIIEMISGTFLSDYKINIEKSNLIISSPKK